MGGEGCGSGRRKRADALRNHERVLEAAKEVFNAGGPGASLETVAERAGVGIGTLYRHFPTREALFEAVYRREVEQLVELAETLRQEGDPVAALRQWLRANVELIATKKGMSEALAVVAARSGSSLAAYSLDRLSGALRELLERAVSAGRVRPDVGAEQIIRTVLGICYTQDGADWRCQAVRMVDVFVDGLAVGRSDPGHRNKEAVKF